MSFILNHLVDIMAIIGAAYTLAVCIVKITPTPKDDQAVEKVGLVIKTICSVFGLTPFQGIRTDTDKTDDPPRLRAALILFAFTLALSFAGCNTLNALHSNERAELVAAQKTFAATVDALADLRAKGAFTQNQADEITKAIIEGRKFLENWAAKAKAGTPQPDAWAAFQEIMARLNALKEGMTS